MAQKSPGKAHREGISLADLFRLFPDDDTAQAWLEEQRWGGEPWCPHCGSFNVRRNKHQSMPWRCAERECRKRFSVRVGTPLKGSPLGYQTWLVAIYLLTTPLKGQSSMKLHRDLNVTQKTAWFLAHRIHKTFAGERTPSLARWKWTKRTWAGNEEGKRLTYADLKQPNGLSSGVRG